MEASPEDPSAWIVTRGRSRKQKERLGEEEDKPEEDKDTDRELEEARRKRDARAQTKDKPGQLVVSITRGNVNRYVEGYLKDPSLEGHWKESLSTADQLLASRRYYKDKDGLLFFRDADWRARLCVPHVLVAETLKEHHESPWETTHVGAACLYHRLAYRYYWPSMWRDVQRFCRSCDICQKIKPDLRGQKGLLRPHQIPALPWDVISLDLITGLPRVHDYDAILVVVDKLSKYALYIPTTTALSQSRFTELFLKHVVQ